MTIGLIGGTNADFAFEWAGDALVETPYGTVEVSEGRVPGTPVEVRFLRRHGQNHERLSASVEHRANVWALHETGCRAIVGTTVCGVVDPEISLGSAIVFDDLYFPENRLPDGSPCTFFTEPGDPQRGHFIFGSPFSSALRACLTAAAHTAQIEAQDRGTYAYALGPRFNSRAEIAAMRAAGVSAVSQTAGPEAVLAGELELPYALIGFGVDYANGVMEEPTSVEDLNANIAASVRAFRVLFSGAAAALDSATFDTGFVYRFE